VVAAVVLASARGGEATTVEERAQAIAAGLRCPVCSNLSVADSPSRLAGEMRADILERLRAGSTDEEVRAFFVARYGEWILLEPPGRGLNLVPLAFPVAALLVGVGAWVAVLRRRGLPGASAPSAAERREIERELAALEDAP
jgi:cytochrome c-type biogenesis protein CcmH